MTSHQSLYKVAAVQAAPAFLDLDAGVTKAIGYIEEAADQGARLVAFPETWLPGYPWWIWLGAPAWYLGRGLVTRYFAQSLRYDSAHAERLCAAARKHRMHVVMGHAERDGGSLYMGQWIIGPQGETIARRRKLKPTHVERTAFGEGDGSGLAVHDTALGRVGALCCWEHIQPLSKYAMYAQNEQLHIAAWPSFSVYDPFAPAFGADINNAASRIYAFEGSCYVLAPCATVSQEMVNLLCDTPEKHALLHTGGGYAVIYGPDGSLLSERLAPDAQGLVTAEIDLDAIAMAKSAADPAGHYARPDVTRLMLNQQVAQRIEAFELPAQTVRTRVTRAAPVLAPATTEIGALRRPADAQSV